MQLSVAASYTLPASLCGTGAEELLLRQATACNRLPAESACMPAQCLQLLEVRSPPPPHTVTHTPRGAGAEELLGAEEAVATAAADVKAHDDTVGGRIYV